MEYADNDFNNERLTDRQEAEQTEDCNIAARASRQCIISRLSKFPVLIKTSTAGLVIFDPHPKVAKKGTVLTAK